MKAVKFILVFGALVGISSSLNASTKIIKFLVPKGNDQRAQYGQPPPPPPNQYNQGQYGGQPQNQFGQQGMNQYGGPPNQFHRHPFRQPYNNPYGGPQYGQYQPYGQQQSTTVTTTTVGFPWNLFGKK
jgi:hypothetical protein